MNDELDKRLRSYFSVIEDDSPASYPMPIHAPSRRPVSRPARPLPAFRYAVAGAGVMLAIVAVLVVRSRNGHSDLAPAGPTVSVTNSSTSAASSPIGGSTIATQPSPTIAAAAPPTFPAIDASAQNYLVVGIDNNACVDSASTTAGGLAGRQSLGERSDTIMIVRVEPANKHIAILSLPRDLWVKIDGTNGKNRINSAFMRNDPQRLINTIYSNFAITIDHFIQVDFCAFKTIVDAVGGVTVPFEFPARDTHTGLDVPTAGCVNLNGDNALAYVRSRHYQYLAPDGQWIEDPAADIGRIGRQQDFIWRTLTSAIDHGLSNVGSVTGLIEAALNDIVTDANLTLDTMLQVAGMARSLEAGAITNAVIPTTAEVIGGASVLIPQVDTADMKAALALVQVRATSTPTVGAAVTTLSGATPTPSAPPSEIVPDRTAQC